MLALDLLVREAERLREFTAIRDLAAIARAHYRAVAFNPVTLGQTLGRLLTAPAGPDIIARKRRDDGWYCRLIVGKDEWIALKTWRDEWGALCEAETASYAERAA